MTSDAISDDAVEALGREYAALVADQEWPAAVACRLLADVALLQLLAKRDTEIARLRLALQDIYACWEARLELYTSDEDCAGALAAKARFAISPTIALVKLPQVAAAENEAMRAALEIYASDEAWEVDGVCDPDSENFEGQLIARHALAQSSKKRPKAMNEQSFSKKEPDMNEIVRLLQKFSASDQWGVHDFTLPFSHGEWTYATDGKIIIRVPRLNEVPDSKNAPHPELLWSQKTVQNFVPVVVSEFRKAGFEQCNVCLGLGKEHDCPDCECICYECEGKGRVEIEGAVSVGPGKLLECHARAIMALPGAEVAPVAEGIMQFRFVGGEGIVSLFNENCDLPVIGSLIAESDDA